MIFSVSYYVTLCQHERLQNETFTEIPSVHKLQKYLNHKETTQRKFAAKIGTSATHLGRLIAGACIPSLRVAFEIEKKTGGLVTVYDWLPTEEREIKIKNMEKKEKEE